MTSRYRDLPEVRAAIYHLVLRLYCDGIYKIGVPRVDEMLALERRHDAYKKGATELRAEF